MPNAEFEGKSEHGDFQEALSKAIETAKLTLQTDYVIWELVKVFGEDGGYITVQVLSVKISAHIPTKLDPAKSIK